MKRKEYYALRALEVTRCPYGDAPTELLEELVQDAAAIARDRILLELALLGGKVPGDPIRCCFSADSYGDSGTVSIKHCHLYQFIQRRMMRIHVFAHCRIHTVCRQHILHQIIRSDTEKIDFFSQFF